MGEYRKRPRWACAALPALLGCMSLHAQDLESLRLRMQAEQDQPYAQRMRTFTAIGLIRSDDAAETLDTAIREASDRTLQIGLAYALAATGRPIAVRRLAEIAGDPAANEWLRTGALDALSRTRPEEALDLALPSHSLPGAHRA